jgi:peptidyl-prolyl cis-trans isomerase A (cyclophilin A)
MRTLVRRSFLRSLAVAALALGLSSAAQAADTKPAAKGAPKAAKNPVVVMKTSMGTIKIELDQAKAPISVENFLKYVDEKFYDGTVFHRVIPTFMIQGGGFTKDIVEKKAHDPIKNEAGNGLKNTRGTLAMARTNVVDSATAQFFVNVVDNAFLDHRDESQAGFGYAVFGKVTSGMEVVDKIKAVKTGVKNGMGDVPMEPVIIESVRRE